MARKETPRYDGLCRALDPASAEARAAAGEPFTVRFKTPKDGTTTVHDYLRGDITVENRNIDDYILVKSDGYALYHLAAMVDDHLMGITHVFRGLEWLGTFPLHGLIIRAFGWQEPVWVHLSVFLKPSGKGKMSKRDVSNEESIFVLGLRDLGYVPEAVNNWIALMGASFGAEETLLTIDELIARFSLDHLTPAAARVNFEKLDHFNGLYLRKLDPADLAQRLKPFLERAGLAPNDGVLRRVAPLVQERIVTLDDVVEMAGFFFRPAPEPSSAELLPKGMAPEQAAAAIQQARALLEAVPAAEWANPGTLEAPLRALAERLGLKPGPLFGMLRVAVTGQSVSPPLFETMAVVGRTETLSRLTSAEATLTAAVDT
jgi:glutamyl-tRNA synthetase